MTPITNDPRPAHACRRVPKGRPRRRAAAPASTAMLSLVAVVFALLGPSIPAAHALAPLSCAAQKASLRLCGASTDNYKDCFNEADGRRELRTWLPWGAIRANGASYALVARQRQFGGVLRVRRTGGNRAMPGRAFVTLSSRSSNIAALELRNGPPTTQWGAFVLLAQPADAAAPVRVDIRLHRQSDRRILARTSATYQHDPVLSGAAFGSAEFNGPGGRWFVGSRRTATDVELGRSSGC